MMFFTNEGTSTPTGIFCVVKGGIANLNRELSCVKYKGCSLLVKVSSSFDELLVASVLSEFALRFDALIELMSW